MAGKNEKTIDPELLEIKTAVLTARSVAEGVSARLGKTTAKDSELKERLNRAEGALSCATDQKDSLAGLYLAKGEEPPAGEMKKVIADVHAAKQEIEMLKELIAAAESAISAGGVTKEHAVGDVDAEERRLRRYIAEALLARIREETWPRIKELISVSTGQTPEQVVKGIFAGHAGAFGHYRNAQTTRAELAELRGKMEADFLK